MFRHLGRACQRMSVAGPTVDEQKASWAVEERIPFPGPTRRLQGAGRNGDPGHNQSAANDGFRVGFEAWKLAHQSVLLLITRVKLRKPNVGLKTTEPF